MSPGIPGGYYVSDEQFAAEMTMLDLVWTPVCMADEVASPNDYVVRTVAGREVVVQNMDGQTRAFLNVCPHRLNRVQTSACGNRPLTCGYHGWEFDADGAPCRIPKRPSFDGIDPAEHAMARYEVAVCGRLVFVCRHAGLPLQTWLGDAWGRIEEMTSACGERLDTNQMWQRCNWKIAVENTLEAYHVGYVHPDTFHRLGANGNEFAFQGPHSSWDTPLSAKTAAGIESMEDVFASRPYRPAGYAHQLVFPNCTIGSAAGMSVAVQFFEPRGVQDTRFLSLTYATKTGELSAAQQERRSLFNRAVVDFNRAVFAEDAAVCERVHDGAADAASLDLGGVLSKDEERVEHHIRAVLTACSDLT